LNTVEVAVDIDLQQDRRVVSRPACIDWSCAFKAQRNQVKLIDEDINHSHRIGIADIVVLSRSKSDNHGKLEQEIHDAFSLVNHNGAAFRGARVTDSYLAARLEELKWAVTAKALEDEEREEQRRLREQIREEEKARHEYERAIKDAAKEEDTLRKAMAVAEAGRGGQ